MEYEHDFKSTMKTIIATQKLLYSQPVDWSKHCAQHQIESPSLEQFAEWLSLTAQTFGILEPFSRNKLGKNDSTFPRSNLSQYGNNHSRYDPIHIQGRSSDMRKTSKFNKEHSQHQRQFKSFRNQQQQLEDQNVTQTSRASKGLFEDGKHRIYMCEKFTNMSLMQRKDAIYQLKAFFNCLNLGHSSKECPSTQSCRNLNKRHHTHLHDESS